MSQESPPPLPPGPYPGFFEDALRECRHALVYIVLFSLGANLLMMGLPLYSLQVMDRVISSGSAMTLWMLSLVTAGLIIGLTLLQEARSLVMIRMSEWLEDRLGGRLLALSIYSAAQRGGSEGPQNLRDLGTIKSFLTGNGIGALCDAPWAPVYLLVIFFIHPMLGSIAAGGALLLLGAALLNEAVVRKTMGRANDLQLRAMARAESSMRNAHAVIAMGMMPAVLKLWQRENDGMVRMQSLASHRSSIVSSIARCMRMLLQIATTACGAVLVLHNQMTIGEIVASSILIGRALGPFETAIATWKSVVDARKSLTRLRQQILSNPPRAEEIALPEPAGKVEAENIVFAPPGTTRPTLRNVSFSLKAGEILGIIGESAAGKSTLAKLLVGVWKPQSGIVRLDSADVYTWNRDHFGRYVGYLPQEVELFEGTIRDNICRLQEEVADESVVKAAQMAGVHEMILGLPQGYRTRIGPGGLGLSAGQRQRVALARAFFGTPRMVVLDEPNANLDADGDAALHASIRRLKANGITCIIISHRPSILSCVDTLMVLRAGQVTDFGPVQDIASKYVPQAAAPAAARAPTSPARQAAMPTPRTSSSSLPRNDV